jgi:hypothetical protein
MLMVHHDPMQQSMTDTHWQYSLLWRSPHVYWFHTIPIYDQPTNQQRKKATEKRSDNLL